SSRPVSLEMSAHVTVIHFDGLSPMCRSARSTVWLIDDAPFGSDHRRGASCSDCRPSGHDARRGDPATGNWRVYAWPTFMGLSRSSLGPVARYRPMPPSPRLNESLPRTDCCRKFDAITVTRSCEFHSRRQVFLMVARFQP